eukprot:UC1_evm1s10
MASTFLVSHYQQELLPWLLALSLNVLWMGIASVIVLLLLARAYIRWRGTHSVLAREIRRGGAGHGHDHRLVLGFFHPYCNAGGGGERVLWCAVNAVHEAYPNVHCVVYTGDVDASKEAILATAQSRFNVTIDAKRVTFIFLQSREWVEARHYPRLTMLLQTLGSLILGWEAVTNCIPDVMLDTMGYAFTYPLFSHLAGCVVGCYVHYPTISMDMLGRVERREAGFNNAGAVSRSAFLSAAKLVYYRVFAYVYGLVGAHARVIMVNSTWTANHVKQLWSLASARVETVYPPCNTSSFGALPLEPRAQQEIVSVAQFRPEKDHALQLKAMAQLFRAHPEYKDSAVLHMVGGCRNAGDEARVASLRALASQLGLREGTDVKFGLNVPFAELTKRLQSATVGLHTMRDEHFGIGVVEFLAAGAIALAHRSAGPLFDIVGEGESARGYLAVTAEEYAQAIHEILSLSAESRRTLQEKARAS